MTALMLVAFTFFLATEITSGEWLDAGVSIGLLVLWVFIAHKQASEG